MIMQLLRRLAKDQKGLVSRPQLLRAGLTRKAIRGLLRRGDVERVHPGVYRLPGAPVTPKTVILAAVLAAGGRCVASPRSAALILGLGELPAPVRVELSVPRGPRGQRPRVRGAKVKRSRSLIEAHLTRHDGVPVTTPARTICDLRDVLPREDVGLVLDHALSRRRVTVEELRAVLEAVPHLRGRSVIEALLAERPTGRARAESPLERELQSLLRAEGFTGWDTQVEVVVAGRRASFDVAFPVAHLALEADSFLHHSSRTDWSRDQRRRSRLIAAGWRILPVTQEDLREERARFVATLRAALASAGVWTT